MSGMLVHGERNVCTVAVLSRSMYYPYGWKFKWFCLISMRLCCILQLIRYTIYIYIAHTIMFSGQFLYPLLCNLDGSLERE
jgi:hypothetical protein